MRVRVRPVFSRLRRLFDARRGMLLVFWKLFFALQGKLRRLLDMQLQIVRFARMCGRQLWRRRPSAGQVRGSVPLLPH